LQRCEDVVELFLVIASSRQLGLELIEFMECVGESELIAAAGKRHRLNVFDILADPLKKMRAPVLALKPGIAIPIVIVRIAAGRLITGAKSIA